MNKYVIRRLMALLVAAWAAGAALASGIVKDVTIRQVKPWQGMVEVDYELTTDVSSKANLATSVVFTDRSTGKSYTATTFTHPFTYTKGKKKMIWNAAKDGISFKSSDVVCTVTVARGEGGVQLWENGPYWAECNVGATKPEEYGYLFWWGDTVGYKCNADGECVSVENGWKYAFDSEDCPTYGKSQSRLKSEGYIDATGNLVAAHDAATAHLGAPWRMPTAAEFSALINNCDTTWTMRGGVYGRLVTGRGAYASRSIFFPAAGCDYGCDLGPSTGGGYWSSTSCSYDSFSFDSGYLYFAWYLNFGSSYFDRNGTGRYHGQSVRPLR